MSGVCTALPAQFIWCICETGCTFPTHLEQPQYFRPIFGGENDVSKHFQLPSFSNFLLPHVTTFLAEDSLASSVLKAGLSWSIT